MNDEHARVFDGDLRAGSPEDRRHWAMQLARTLGIAEARALPLVARRTMPESGTFRASAPDHARILVGDYFSLQTCGIGYGDHLGGFGHPAVNMLLREMGRHVRPLVEIASGRWDHRRAEADVLWMALRGVCQDLCRVADTLHYPAAWDRDEIWCCGASFQWHLFWDRAAVLADVPKQERYGTPFEGRPSRRDRHRDLVRQAHEMGSIERVSPIAHWVLAALFGFGRSTVLRPHEGTDRAASSGRGRAGHV